MSNIIRALRLPFLSASVIPFIFGSLIPGNRFNFPGFLFGILCAACTHLSANLINDYADSKSGVDWQDRNFYNFFGGSKLIQEKVFSEEFYLMLALFFATLAAIFAVLLALAIKNLSVIGFYLIIIALGWLYTQKPLQFSYHKVGEIFVFILFGPVIVMGAYFIQSGIFPDAKSFILSLPFGFLTCAILFANEVPDYGDDKKAAKFTWVSLTGLKCAFMLYAALIACAFFTVWLGITLKYITPVAVLSFLLIIPAIQAAYILKKYPSDKIKLMTSSKITILIQGLTGVMLIIGVLR
jgi:1,4-dihydroxy-2-naphthoate octaprenyltransferase